jgi:NIPSNAP
MLSNKWALAVVGAGMFAAGFALRGEVGTPDAHAQGANRVFEIRTYTAQPGKFEAMKARFKDHIVPTIFPKYGLTVIGFWTAADAPLSENTLVYVLAHTNREEAKKNWDAFRTGPERAKVWAETERDGPINLKVESMFANPVDYSPIR